MAVNLSAPAERPSPRVPSTAGGLGHEVVGGLVDGDDVGRREHADVGHDGASEKCQQSQSGETFVTKER